MKSIQKKLFVNCYALFPCEMFHKPNKEQESERGRETQHVKQKEKRAIFFAKLIAEPLNGKMQYNQISREPSITHSTNVGLI